MPSKKSKTISKEKKKPKSKRDLQKELTKDYLSIGSQIVAVEYQMEKDKPKRSFEAYRERQKKRKKRIQQLQDKQQRIMTMIAKLN